MLTAMTKLAIMVSLTLAIAELGAGEPRHSAPETYFAAAIDCPCKRSGSGWRSLAIM